MTILITGGTGKTGAALAQRLHAANIPFLIASRVGRAPDPFKAVVFDWRDPATFENPFRADPSIDRVYLVVPDPSLAVHVRPFIELARLKGVKRFVLLDGSQVAAGAVLLGGIPQYLVESGVEYTILRPTWFQQNFGTSFVTSIRDYDETSSATGDGRIAFVSTEDVAEVALEGLTADPSLNEEVLIFGPVLYTHDEVAKLLSKLLGREIIHRRHTVEELKNMFIADGLDEQYADVLAGMEREAARHVEQKLFNSSNMRKFVGKHSLEDYIRVNLGLWVKS